MSKRQKAVASSLLLALVLASFLFAQHAHSKAEQRIYERTMHGVDAGRGEDVSDREMTRQLLAMVQADVPDSLLRVAYCESENRQFIKGEVVIGKVTPDIGRFQINPMHLQEAKRKGMDVYTYKGNTDYALYLYNRNGLRDWTASKHCWSDPIALKEKGYPNS